MFQQIEKQHKWNGNEIGCFSRNGKEIGMRSLQSQVKKKGEGIFFTSFHVLSTRREYHTSHLWRNQGVAASGFVSMTAETTTSTNTPQPEKDVSFEGDYAGPNKLVQQPRSALASLVESARLKERLQKTENSERKTRAFMAVSEDPLRSNNEGANIMLERHKSPTASEQSGDDFGVALPLGSFISDDTNDPSKKFEVPVAKHPSQMSQEEFLRQFKRAPRRGEIGYDAESVAAAEAVGYVMSGTRNKEKQHYVDNIQRKLHEKEARKLRLQFRKVEDERTDNTMIQGTIAMVNEKTPNEGL
ncbi:hypothetical protein, conserved [Trypanosoma cruzi]|uniref:NF-kappa-B-activating protein C-terminal domain-containing protein n=1 Tax=Trypanosoma cruzi (strain CL Brener) TaxID=353153 RepID=Q4DZS0_TRYCC|nr:hypothetical protein, conserved [Trypanosoma cruzi]EAN98003.1 hypothetical protein, conserved [Trypanosoma cruzi]|eukprot:XP_819854.1 hypothetical protein [Trypanosoma cruzi strain CL Brener]